MSSTTLQNRTITPDTDTIEAKLQKAVTSACGRIMPAWPLDQAVAVNPHWRRIDMPIRQVAARLAVMAEFHVFPPRNYIKQEWDTGKITNADLDTILNRYNSQHNNKITAQQCIQALSEPLHIQREPLIVDLLDDEVQKNKRWPWNAALIFQISQTCATYFDRQEAHWRAAGSPSLYGFWRESMVGDHGLSSRLGLPGFMKQIRSLPLTSEEAVCWAIDELGLSEASWENYFEALLLSINGWASWCAYIGWQNIPAGKDDPRLRELLACRLAWEVLIARSVPEINSHQAKAELITNWQKFDLRVEHAKTVLTIDEIWQQALEASFQRDFANKLSKPLPANVSQAPEVQAVFCIDTRSELMRRALESIWPDVQTRAFAGFFGLPLSYNLLGTDIERPQLPGLAYPNIAAQDIVTSSGKITPADADSTNKIIETRQRHLARLDQWLGTVRWSNATFSFVEAFGISYLPKILNWIKPTTQPRQSIDNIGLPSSTDKQLRPMLVGLDIDKRVSLAADALHTMGLDDRLAPLVILCGHAGHTTNNAHASTLDCGACYGRPGEANARALAILLNDPEVRAGLHSYNIHIPANTVFMGALHNTTTDEVTGFDLDLLTDQAKVRWQKMEQVFAQAGDLIRRERAPTLWMDDKLEPEALLNEFRRRANDGSQTRPEWGLTRNAAFIIGPRSRTYATEFKRAFLHDYDNQFDADGSILEKLMMGPMLVTNWLSWQYHASTCDPQHYGAGNKVLHNVVDGHVGVFEGNGGDLRIGLPKQSVHNGEGWYHQPVRLTVVIDAPAQAIEAIIARNVVLGQLFDNGWMLLWRYEKDQLQRYDSGKWLSLDI